MTTAIIAALLFISGVLLGVVALLEPTLGLLSIIRQYLRRILSGRVVPELEIKTTKKGRQV